LVRRSGKETDGIFSQFNRSLCRPLVRWLSKTPVTPNLITFSGLLVVLLSGYWYAQGYWLAYVLGGLFYFLSVLFDEMDGMLARLTFKESAFGCWLETVVDYASYVVVFTGMTVGLYRESGAIWLWQGGLLLTGAFISFLVLGRQRKLATDPDKPNEYLIRIQQRLEADSGNPLSRFARLSEFAIRKSFLSHCIPIFTLLGGLKVFFFISAFGSHLVWLLGLSFNRFFRQPETAQTVQAGGILTAFGQTKGSNQ
jgi:phosphatidylglycerophosphate synthase